MESQRLFKFFAKMSEELQENTLENTIQTYYMLKAKTEYQNYKRAQIYRLSLLNSLEKMYSIMHLEHSKNLSRNLSKLEAQTVLREKMINTCKKRPAKKREKILGQYCSLIYQLRFDKKKEFTWIVMYLKRFHKFQVNHTYLYKLYPQIMEKMSIRSAENEEKDK